MFRVLLPVIATLAAAVLGGLGSVASRDLYQQLDKPAWAPPASVFGPAWTILYTLMAIAAVLVARRAGTREAGAAMALFGCQLALNALWPWLFFRWRLGGVALAEIVLLLVVLLFTILVFARIHRLAALLLLPYLAWVGYATALTWSVWRRNPELLAAVARGFGSSSP
jgi:tryptophan-rich sensory protein